MMNELLRKGYIGNSSQLATVRRVTLCEGKARGTEIIEVKTAGGLELEILPNTGLDIGQTRFKGINMSWLSKNGYDSPSSFLPYETEFMNTFPGGLLYTCGLRSAGPANRDNGEWHPLHGRIHGQQAEQICAAIQDDEIVVSGVIRETAFFGQNLEVKRTIRIPVFGSSVTIHDTITNFAPMDEEIMLLYHCNFAYPLLSEKATLVLPEDRETKPRNDHSKTGLGRELVFDEPIPGAEERVFFQIMKNEYWARLENPEIGVNMTLTWSGDTLPILSEWRSMAGGDYVLGLEPTNGYIMGRHDERENGTLKVLKAFESTENTVKIEFC